MQKHKLLLLRGCLCPYKWERESRAPMCRVMWAIGSGRVSMASKRQKWWMRLEATTAAPLNNKWNRFGSYSNSKTEACWDHRPREITSALFTNAEWTQCPTSFSNCSLTKLTSTTNSKLGALKFQIAGIEICCQHISYLIGTRVATWRMQTPPLIMTLQTSTTASQSSIFLSWTSGRKEISRSKGKRHRMKAK